MEPQGLLQQYRQLLAAYQGGSMSLEQFQQACQDLRGQGPDGTWWTVDAATGGLLSFDQASGAWRPAGVPSSPPGAGQEAGAQGIISVLRTVRDERTGLAAAFVVLAVSAAISLVGWIPLSLPSRLIGAVVPEGNCVDMDVQSVGMYACSAKVAALTVAGPIAIVVLLFILRPFLTKWIGQLIPRLPTETHFLVGPVLATLLFTLVWAGVHHTTAGQTGLMPQMVFPAVVGLLTFAMGRYGPDLQRSLAPFFDFRDNFPRWTRFVAAAAVPLLLSLIVTYQERVSQTALKEQFIVIVAIATGYLALAPRSGDIMSGVRRMMPGQHEGP